MRRMYGSILVTHQVVLRVPYHSQRASQASSLAVWDEYAVGPMEEATYEIHTNAVVLETPSARRMAAVALRMIRSTDIDLCIPMNKP